MIIVEAPPHYWREGDPLITVTSPWEVAPYAACPHTGCTLPVTIATGSPMRWWGLGMGYRSWECVDGHRYAYQPQDGEISHVRSV